jgi:peptidoglycan/xylan/chitin deacetylase (PgdA/CDA1 family)
LIFPKLLWHKPNRKNEIYLTFDDGPNSQVTNYVLEVLNAHCIKATFFCLGKHINDNQEVVNRIVDEGHGIGMHGFEHLDGWKVSRTAYQQNVKEGQNALDAISNSSHYLYRPPYGHIPLKEMFSHSQMIKTVMWSVLAGDFDGKLSKEKCLQRIRKNTKSGDIIVLHDNEKSFDTLQYVLPRYLQSCLDNGFIFKTLKHD